MDTKEDSVDNAEKVIVDVVNDTPLQDQGRPKLKDDSQVGADKEGDAELEAVSDSVKKRIAELKFQAHDQRRKREEAERQREEAVKFAAMQREQYINLQKRAHAGEVAFVETAKDKLKIELESAERAYKEAYEAGDAERIAEATKRMSRANAQAVQFEGIQPREPDPPPNLPLRQVMPDERAVDWVRKNSWFQLENGAPKNSETAIALGIHANLLAANGADFPERDPDTYYRELNRRVRAALPERYQADNPEHERDDQTAQAAATGTRPPATIVASASRSQAGTGPRRVQLTASQVALCERLNIPLEEFAKELLKVSTR